MEQPLEGIKVIDLSQFLSGPRCTELLADFGAEVIKLEPPLGEAMRWLLAPIPGLDRSMSNWNRNKKGITLDIRNSKGREIFLKLIPHFDVLVENLAKGTLDKLGLGYKELSKVNPGLIYCSITGFGLEGPFSHRVAFDLIAQSMAGILSAMRLNRVHPVFFGDFVSGAYGAYGILLALIHRQKTGRGQLIDISMQDVLYFHNYPAIQARSTEEIKEDIKDAVGGSFDDFFSGEKGVPFWNIYEAKDGYIAIVFLTDSQWKKICDIIGHPELKDDPRFSNVILRTRNREEYRQYVKDWISKNTLEQISKVLDENKIPFGILQTVEQVNKDPNLIEREMITWVDDELYGKIPVPGIPIKLSLSPGKIRSSAPRLGEHNLEIYSKYLGLSEEEINDLKKQGVI